MLPPHPQCRTHHFLQWEISKLVSEPWLSHDSHYWTCLHTVLLPTRTWSSSSVCAPVDGTPLPLVPFFHLDNCPSRLLHRGSPCASEARGPVQLRTKSTACVFSQSSPSLAFEPLRHSYMCHWQWKYPISHTLWSNTTVFLTIVPPFLLEGHNWIVLILTFVCLSFHLHHC